MVAARHRAAADRAERNADKPLPADRGLTYWEVQQIAKAAPTSITPCGEDTIRRWVSGRYQIALRFNRYDICLGVEEEIDG